MHNGNLEWKVLTRHINQQLEGKRWTQEKEAPRRECLEDRCGEDERWWMWGRTGHYFCHSLLICSLSIFFSHQLFSATASLCLTLLILPSHYIHFGLMVCSQIPLFIPSSLWLAWEAGAHSIYHPPIGLHLIKGAHLRAWWRLLLLLWTLPDRSHVEIRFQLWTNVDSKTKTLIHYMFKRAAC